MSDLIKLMNHSMPQATNVTYNAEKNMFLANGYTSIAGNTYFKGIHINKRLILVFDIGSGYAHNFLNGISIYRYNGKGKELITSQYYHCFFFNESAVYKEAFRLLTNHVKSSALLMNMNVSDKEIECLVKEQMVELVSPKIKGYLK